MVQIFDNGPEFDSEVTTLDELLERLNEIKAAHPTALVATYEHSGVAFYYDREGDVVSFCLGGTQ